MPLTDSQRLMAKMILGLQADSGVFNNRITTLSSRLNELTAAEVGLVTEILAEFETVRFKTGKLTGSDYQDDPARKRTLLRGQLAQVIGLDEPCGPQLLRG